MLLEAARKMPQGTHCRGFDALTQRRDQMGSITLIPLPPTISRASSVWPVVVLREGVNHVAGFSNIKHRIVGRTKLAVGHLGIF